MPRNVQMNAHKRTENDCPNCPPDSPSTMFREQDARLESMVEFMSRDGVKDDGVKAGNMLLHSMGGSHFDYLRTKYSSEEDFGHLVLLGGLTLGRFMHVPDGRLFAGITDAWSKPFKYQVATTFSIWKDSIDERPEEETNNRRARALIEGEHLKIIEGMEKAYSLFD